MAKVEIILKDWQTLKNKAVKEGEKVKPEDEKHPIVLRVSHRNERRLYATKISATANQWDDVNGIFIRDKRITKNYEDLNQVLNDLKSKARDIITEFEKQGVDFTLTQFENEFRKEKPKDITVSAYFDQHIKKLTEAKRFGYADIFRSTLVILKIFDRKFTKIKFPDIDKKYIERFDLFLRHERKIKDTSISVYMRTLSILLNAAIEDRLMPAENYPFGKRKSAYKISNLNTKTSKRFIPVNYLQTIKNATFDDLRLEITRNLFLFSFHCRGLNWIDMAQLTNANISKGVILKSGKVADVLRYRRAKTGKEYEIKINTDIQQLLDWFRSIPHCKPYLLPIVTVPEHEGEAMRLHIKERLHKHNKALREIAEKLELPDSLQNISSYYSRHSFAMAMRSKGKSIEIISEALGHADTKITTVYLDSFGLETVADETENLI